MTAEDDILQELEDALTWHKHTTQDEKLVGLQIVQIKALAAVLGVLNEMAGRP